MWQLRGSGWRALGLAAAVVAGLGLAALVTTAGPVPTAHAQTGGSAEPGIIVAADRGNDRLQMFYPDGTFALKFGEGYGDASSIDVGPDGRIVVAVPYGSVRVFHPNGTYAFAVAEGGYDIGRIGGHSEAAVAPDGRIVVMETSGRTDGRVQVFGPDGGFESVFTVQGRDRIDVGPNGLIVVSGGGQKAIQAFHLNGTLAFSFDGVGGSSVWHASFGPEGEIVTLERSGYLYGRYGGSLSDVHVYRPLPNGTYAHYPINGTTYRPSTDVIYFGEPVAVPGIERGGFIGVIDLAVGPAGRIVMGARDYVTSYYPNGTAAAFFGGHGSVQGGFNRPTDAAVGPDGRIVVAEPGINTISVFHPNGTLDFSFGSYGHGDDGFYRAHQVAVGPDGRIVVGDTGKNRILVFNPDGTPSMAFGSGGGGVGQVAGISDVAVAPNGSVVVADYRRVQVFSPDGSSVSELPPSGLYGTWYPGAAAVGPDGRIVVTDDGSWLVHVFDPNGTKAFTIQMTTSTRGGDIVVGPDGRIEVVQGSGRHVFSPDGEFLFAAEIDVLAVSVAIGPDGEIVVVDDRDDRVQVFNPNGTFAFSLLPDLSEGKFDGVGSIAVGPAQPPPRDDPDPLRVAIEAPGGGGGAPILRNFTNVGDAANVTIDVTALAGPGGADSLNGSESSTVTFPTSETVVAASFAEVTFPSNVTASHVPAGGRLALRVATDVPAAEQVQAALGRNGSGGPEVIVLLQGVVEVGAEGPRIVFDLPVRISLEGQAGGRAFYIEGANGAIVPIDGACAANGVDAVHRQLGGVGECQMDSADGTAKIVYTYHLTKFGTVSAEGPVPARTDAVDPPAGPPPVVVPPPVPVNGTFGGGGGGGGGNATNGTAGPPTPQPVVPPTPQPVVPPTPQPQQPPGGDGGQPVVPPPVVVVPPPGVVDMCGVVIDFPALDMSARPGEYSEPVEQVVRNAGTLPLARVEIVATPWHDGSGPPTPPPLPGVPPPYSGPTQGRTAGAFTAYMIASLPASVTEVREGPRVEGRQITGGGPYVPLADDGRGTAVLDGLGSGAWAPLSFRLNLTAYDGLLAGALVQSVTYQAECAPPSTSPAP